MMAQDPPAWWLNHVLWPVWAVSALLIYLLIHTVRRSFRKGRLLHSRPKRPIPSASLPHFVIARVMDPIMPMARGRKYEEPLDDALREHEFGMVVGGGSQMNEQNQIAWVELDIQLANLDSALDFTRGLLCELGAPSGSLLHYKSGSERKALSIA